MGACPTAARSFGCDFMHVATMQEQLQLLPPQKQAMRAAYDTICSSMTQLLAERGALLDRLQVLSGFGGTQTCSLRKRWHCALLCQCHHADTLPIHRHWGGRAWRDHARALHGGAPSCHVLSALREWPSCLRPLPWLDSRVQVGSWPSEATMLPRCT